VFACFSFDFSEKISNAVKKKESEKYKVLKIQERERKTFKKKKKNR
jgi:hypothetical protein